MSSEPAEDNRTPEERERDRKQKDHIAKIKRWEQLDRAVEQVLASYRKLSHLADPGSAEKQEFEQQRDHYMKIGREVYGLSEAEQNQILEAYPKLAARLKREHDL